MVGPTDIELYYDIQDLNEHDKLLLIKKLPFMKKGYAKFMAYALVDCKAASEVTFSNNLTVEVEGEEVSTIGLILYNSSLKDYLVGYILGSITAQYIEKNTYSKNNILKDFKEPKSSTVDNLLGGKFLDGFIGLNGADSASLNTKNTIDYIADYPVCPNLAVDVVKEEYIATYEDLVYLSVMSKYDPSIPKAEIDELKKRLDILYKEYISIYHLERDCDKCPQSASCGILK